MKKTVKLFSLLMVICMLLSSCAQSAGEVANTVSDSIVKNDDIGNTLDTEHHSASSAQNRIPEKGTYNEGVALVKYDGELNDNVLSQVGLVSATELYSGSSWYTVELKADADTVETVIYLRELGCFETVDYDYIMGVTADVSSVDVSSNPDYGKQDGHHTHKIPDGWGYMYGEGKNPGGSSDVIIAVIDTGVDYNHVDLRNNIWVNQAEIPNNGKDDDKNGYVDDVHGWDCVGNDNDPMDDNGHGTHVAGIIAAENNTVGGVGVAYNCKIMVLKAGNSSGYFNNSDIAEAIQYAYMNGASVINMSFGGSQIAVAVEDALENAYNNCVLVAAAGNSGLCNQPDCQACNGGVPSYPAALPYVIGVMSTNASGTAMSPFSNFDHHPHNSYEYEVYAVGENVSSTWPGNKYAQLNGTSMAAPTVSGIAALLRSMYPDRETYSTKYLQSQIVNTGSINPYNPIIKESDSAHSVANIYEALTKIPTPNVHLYDYYILDSKEWSSVNNENGVMDAGETVRLLIKLQNNGGVASNVSATIDTIRNNDPSLTDPYFSITTTILTMSDIGTYSIRNPYEDEYFEITIASNCPNDYLADFNIHFSYTNGLDAKDTKTYYGSGVAQFGVSNGYRLEGTIRENTVFTNDRLYIIADDLIIPKGITVTFEEGCQIHFYDDREYYNSPIVYIYGTLNLLGTKQNLINVLPSEMHEGVQCTFYVRSGGDFNMDYVIATGICVDDDESFGPAPGTSLKNSRVYLSASREYANGDDKGSWIYCDFDTIENSFIEVSHHILGIHTNNLLNSFIHAKVYGTTLEVNSVAKNNIFYSGYTDSSKSMSFSGTTENNIFITSDGEILKTLSNISFSGTIKNNFFSSLYQKYAGQVISGYYDSNGNATVDVYSNCSDISLMWPYVVNVEIFDKDGNDITVVGKEEIKVRVTFNRPMDITKDTFLSFGTIKPYEDYRIDGEWVSNTVWEGNYTLRALIENGQNFLKVNNACAAEDHTKIVFGEYNLHEFTIDTTEAMSMNLQAIAKENGIELTFAQDDYDTLLGYNIYRATSKDGNYVKLNPAILLPTDSTFLDENAEPGKTYWYTYTVVLTDFTESNPAGKVVATAMDTLAPNMYHTPVNQGYTNNNLVISCTASDNVAISAVTLYYRTVGETEWKTLSMSKQSDKYSATIFGSELTLDGVEYYIVATDGRNTINKGSEETPYTILVKDASSISRKGDVDGDGVVTTKDALMLMQCINGDLILTDDEFKRADLNGDNMLNTSEALRILQYINGNVNTLEM